MLKISQSLSKFFSIYLVPGLVFQSVIVGGGYGTGREIAEFFLIHGAQGGLLGMLISSAVWGVVLAVAFEFSRITQSYNYKTFFQGLLGKSWWLFEVIYFLIALLVLAVLGSASGEIVAQMTGLSSLVGTFAMMGMVGVLTFLGSQVIEKVFVGWSVLLYGTYIVLAIISFTYFGDIITTTLKEQGVAGNWGMDGVRYAAYNLNALAAVIFIAPRFQRTRQAVGAGVVAGIIAVVPGILVFLVLLGAYPQSLHASVPVMSVLSSLNIVWLTFIFQIMLFGTFIETGTGMIHAVNERLANTLDEKGRAFPAWTRAVIAITALAIAIGLADSIGIIDLIAKGYGLLSYGYLAVVILPLLTIGLWRIIKAKRNSDDLNN